MVVRSIYSAIFENDVIRVPVVQTNVCKLCISYQMVKINALI